MNHYGHNRLTRVQSKKFIGQRRTRIIVASILLIVSISSWFFVLVRASNLSFLQVKSVEVIGVGSDIRDSLQASAISSLQGAYFGLFSKNNVFMYPKDEISKKIASSSPRIKAISIGKSGFNDLVISVTERDPSATVCVKLPDEGQSESTSTVAMFDSQESCFLADSSGLIFEQAATSTLLDRFYVPDLLDLSTSPSPIGLFATSTDKFIALLHLYDDLKKYNITPFALLVKKGGEYEAYVNLGSSHLSSINLTVLYFNDTMTFADQLSNLVSFWNKFESQARKGGTVVEIDYIDLRYGANIFYRAR